MIALDTYPARVGDALLSASYEIETHGRSYLVVAWASSSGAQTVRTTARHLLDPDRYLTTLCGRRFRVSKIVTPNTYWTDSTCQRCKSIAAKGEQ